MMPGTASACPNKTDKQKYHLCSSRDMTQKIFGRSRMDSADTAAVA